MGRQLVHDDSLSPEELASAEHELAHVERSRELIDEWVNEMESFEFSGGKMKSVGKHDDLAMAFYICIQATKQSTFTFDFIDTDITAEYRRELEEEMLAQEAELHNEIEGGGGQLTMEERMASLTRDLGLH